MHPRFSWRITYFSSLENQPQKLVKPYQMESHRVFFGEPQVLTVILHSYVTCVFPWHTRTFLTMILPSQPSQAESVDHRCISQKGDQSGGHFANSRGWKFLHVIDSTVISQSIRLQVAANEYLDRAGISSHAIWLNCDVFFGFFNLTVQVALNFPGPFRWKNQHPSDRTWPRCPCCLLWRWHWLLHKRNGWLLGTARCKAGAIQSCTKCRIYTEEMAWIMATGWRFCWNPGVCCSFKAGYQEHPVTLQDTWRFMTLTPVWPVLKQSVLGCFCCLLSQRHRPPARGVNIQAEPPGESRYGFRHGIRRSKLVRNPSPCIPVTVLTVVSAVG